MRAGALAVLVCLWLGVERDARAQESWARAQARSLSSQAASEAAAGRPEGAVRLYLEALTIDGSFRPGYLGLGATRERLGDLVEAERVYAAGIDRVPGFWEALSARARLLRRLGRRGDAGLDQREAIRLRPDDAALLEELASWCIEDADFPQALALYRRLRRVTAQADDATRARVALRVKALGALVAGADPLRARHGGVDPVRRGIEGVARAKGL